MQSVQEEIEDQRQQQQYSPLDTLFPSTASSNDDEDLSSSADTIMAGVPSADEQAAGFEAVMSSESPDMSLPAGDMGEFGR